MLNKQKIGVIGENIACRFLENKYNFKIIKRNYRKKWGEIDIIAEKDNMLHFVEVKTVSCETGFDTENIKNPEENIHPWKLKRLSRTIQSYLMEKDTEGGDWQFDTLAVFLFIKDKKARVRFFENIVLS
ncbi:MAG: YraN family protein [Parcubacteria group bacterium]|nr:YraN family protein [Parcubacteria group bacterium]